MFPSSFWDRLMLVCFYVILYNVGGHERYYQMKKKYLDAPINNIYSKILKDEYDADVSSSEGSDVYANEVDASASAGLGSGANEVGSNSSRESIVGYVNVKGDDLN